MWKQCFKCSQIFREETSLLGGFFQSLAIVHPCIEDVSKRTLTRTGEGTHTYTQDHSGVQVYNAHARAHAKEIHAIHVRSQRLQLDKHRANFLGQKAFEVVTE